MVRRDSSRQQNKSKSDRTGVKGGNSSVDRSGNRKRAYTGQQSGRGSFGKKDSRDSGKRNTGKSGEVVRKNFDRASGKGSLQNRSNSIVKETTEVRAYGVSAEGWNLPVSVSVETEEQLKAALSVNSVKLIYVDEACFGFAGDMGGSGAGKVDDRKAVEAEAFAVIIQSIHAAGKQAGLRLRRIERDTDPCLDSRELVERLVSLDAAPEVLLIRSYDEAMMFDGLDTSESGNKGLSHIRKVFDYTCYGYNTEAVSMLLELGAEKLTYPIELTYRECLSLRHALREQGNREQAQVPYDVLVYGHLPMMVSANCIQRTSDRCDHRNRILKLRDRMQKDMPVRCYCKYCYNQIFNAEPLVLYDCREEIHSLDAECVRYDFTVETGREVQDILSGAIPDNKTRGHFRHGIE